MAAKERAEMQKAARDQDTELRKTALQVAGQIEVAKIAAGAKAQADAVNAANDAEKIKGEQERADKETERTASEGADARKIMEDLLGRHEELLKTLSAPIKIVRDGDGKMASLQRVK